MASQVAMQEENVRKGPWFEEEDERLTAIVALLGERRWDALAKASGLKRSGKSCRLRWMNYLRPNLKHGDISEEEEHIILQLHHQWGNKWSKIARRLRGRTDNEIKNYWRSHLKKKAQFFEKENLENVVNTKQELVVPTRDGVTLRTSDGDSTSEEDDGIPANSVDSSGALEFSNLGFANSPYEARVSDWIWSWPYEENEGKIHGESCNLDSGFCYLGSFEDDDTSSFWDCSNSIWDLY